MIMIKKLIIVIIGKFFLHTQGRAQCGTSPGDIRIQCPAQKHFSTLIFIDTRHEPMYSVHALVLLFKLSVNVLLILSVYS